MSMLPPGIAPETAVARVRELAEAMFLEKRGTVPLAEIRHFGARLHCSARVGGSYESIGQNCANDAKMAKRVLGPKQARETDDAGRTTGNERR